MKKLLTITLMMLMLAMPLFTGCGSNQTNEAEEAAGSTESESMAEYPISDANLDEKGPLLQINTEGMGQIARADQDHEIAFDDEYPTQQTADHLKEGTVLKIAAKADDGWRFVKWTLGGKDYSTDEQIEYTVTEDAELLAVFDVAE